MKKIKVNITGMTCDHCARSIEKNLRQAGVSSVRVEYSKAEAQVEFDEKHYGEKDVIEAIRKAGPYEASISEPDDAEHLIIIGGGSAAFAAAMQANEMGYRVTMINDGLPIGGTCVNVGCVPSKYLIRAAEKMENTRRDNFPGIKTAGTVENFSALMAGKADLVQALRSDKYISVLEKQENVTFIQGRARIVSPKKVQVNNEIIAGSGILIATGAKATIPSIPGIESVEYLTNEEALALEELPESVIIIGGRYIALELAQIFSGLGSRVTVLQRSTRLIPDQTEDISLEIEKHLSGEGIKIHTGNSFQRIAQREDYIEVHTEIRGESRIMKAQKLIIATGRTPNTADMGLEEVGVELDEKGAIRVDDYLQTTVPGIAAAGDVLGKNIFVYTAAYEGKLAVQNMFSTQKIKTDYSILPWVIFTNPQVAGVGMDEIQAEKAGFHVQTATLEMKYVPRALAAADTRGFIKLIRDIQTDKLLGARIVAPEGSELLMEVAVSMRAGLTVSALKDMFHPYLTLSEAVKLAAITFSKNVTELSCCAT